MYSGMQNNNLIIGGAGKVAFSERPVGGGVRGFVKKNVDFVPVSMAMVAALRRLVSVKKKKKARRCGIKTAAKF